MVRQSNLLCVSFPYATSCQILNISLKQMSIYAPACNAKEYHFPLETLYNIHLIKMNKQQQKIVRHKSTSFLPITSFFVVSSFSSGTGIILPES